MVNEKEKKLSVKSVLNRQYSTHA